jgi:hypothetical protein
MKKIIMLETKSGSPNGIQIERYYKGETYTVTDKLYNAFKKCKWCKDFVEVANEEPKIEIKKKEVIEEKKIEVPKNKMANNKGYSNKKEGK